MNYTPITQRTRDFAIRIVKACSYLEEQSNVCKTLSRQLLRSGTSIGANVAEAQSAQSNRDFISKLEIALKEARETRFWLDILINSDLPISPVRFKDLFQEVDEVISILVTSVDKLKKKL